MSSKPTPRGLQQPNRPCSPTSSNGSSSKELPHAPKVPSALRTSHQPPSSPETTMSGSHRGSSASIPSNHSKDIPVEVEQASIRPTGFAPAAGPAEADLEVQGGIEGPAKDAARAFLHHQWEGDGCPPGQCTHGTFSPRPMSIHENTYGFPSPTPSENGFGGRYPEDIGDEGSSTSGVPREVLGDAITDGLLSRDSNDPKNMTTTRWLAKKYRVKNDRMMYLMYYIPFFNWIRQYKWSYFRGDLVAAFTMASFYIPMSLSLASNLAHIPPIYGLYSFVFSPFMYAIFGSCTMMVMGPEAAGSLLVGSVVRSSVDKGHSGDDDNAMNAQIAGVVTGMSGAIILIAGLTRLGFLDSVLSRPFLRGFISAIGFVIVVDQLLPEMGLESRAAHVGVSHGSSVDKIEFLFGNIRNSHGLTCAVAFGSFGIIMLCRELKSRLQPRFPRVAYVPDRFLIVVLSAILTWRFGWDKKGLEILGPVESASGNPFTFRWPFQFSHMKHVREAMGTSFLIGILGFFESSVAAKSLEGIETGGDGIQGIQLSANRELVALGIANIFGGCFQSLPAFGGYGRSKVNASTGGKTPMSSIFLSIITILCILFIMPYFYYVPKSVLSAMISVVAWSLIEEAPHDLRYFWKIRGWPELSLMFLIFAATIFYSLTLGIAIGAGLSILQVIRHSTRPRIQILGRVPGTTDRFENAEADPERIEFIKGCLIVKIPEPLTFANTGELKRRLRRLEDYGTNAAHPALPRVRNPAHNKNIIFDIHGVTQLDGSGSQVLRDIVEEYVSKGVRVFFCRIPGRRTRVYRLFELSGIMDLCGGPSHFVQSVDEALRMTEVEDVRERFTDDPEQG